MVSIAKSPLPCHRLPTSVNVRIASSSQAMDILLFLPLRLVFCGFLSRAYITRVVGRFLMARTVQEPVPKTSSIYLKYSPVRARGM